MQPTSRWVDAQKCTPSFVYEAHASYPEAATLLETPLPAAKRRTQSPGPTRGIVAAASPAAKRRAVTPSGRSIHEDLLERGKLMNQRKEAMQERARRAELKKCRQVPSISPMAKAIDRSENIVARLYKLQKEKDKAQQYKITEVVTQQEHQLEQYFKPTLSHRGKRAAGKTQSAQQELWSFKRAERVEQLRREKIMKEMEEVLDSPSINPRSEALAARRREKEGLAGYSHVEAMLEKDRLAHLAKWEQQQVNFMRENPGTPRITQMAAEMDRGANIAERLYAEATEMEQRKALRAQELLLEEQMMASRSPDQSRYVSDGAERLEERNFRFLQERDAKIQKILEMDRERHRPAIDPVSDAIASRLPKSTMERLSTTPKKRATITAPAAPTATSYESPSNEGAEVTPRRVCASDVEAYNRMILSEARKQQRLSALREDRLRHEMQQCTFHPETTVPVESTATPPKVSVYERSQEWAKQKEEKIKQIRDELKDSEGRACTFNPETTDVPRNVVARSASDGLQGAGGCVKGYDDYVARQAEARRKTEEGVALSPSPADAKTVSPKPFNLGQRNADIAALRPPVSPPIAHLTPEAAKTPSAPNPTPSAADQRTRLTYDPLLGQQERAQNARIIASQVLPQSTKSPSTTKVEPSPSTAHRGVYEQPLGLPNEDNFFEDDEDNASSAADGTKC